MPAKSRGRYSIHSHQQHMKQRTHAASLVLSHAHLDGRMQKGDEKAHPDVCAVHAALWFSPEVLTMHQKIILILNKI